MQNQKKLTSYFPTFLLLLLDFFFSGFHRNNKFRIIQEGNVSKVVKMLIKVIK